VDLIALNEKSVFSARFNQLLEQTCNSLIMRMLVEIQMYMIFGLAYWI